MGLQSTVGFETQGRRQVPNPELQILEVKVEVNSISATAAAAKPVTAIAEFDVGQLTQNASSTTTSELRSNRLPILSGIKATFVGSLNLKKSSPKRALLKIAKARFPIGNSTPLDDQWLR